MKTDERKTFFLSQTVFGVTTKKINNDNNNEVLSENWLMQ